MSGQVEGAVNIEISDEATKLIIRKNDTFVDGVRKTVFTVISYQDDNMIGALHNLTPIEKQDLLRKVGSGVEIMNQKEFSANGEDNTKEYFFIESNT